MKVALNTAIGARPVFTGNDGSKNKGFHIKWGKTADAYVGAKKSGGNFAHSMRKVALGAMTALATLFGASSCSQDPFEDIVTTPPKTITTDTLKTAVDSTRTTPQIPTATDQFNQVADSLGFRDEAHGNQQLESYKYKYLGEIIEVTPDYPNATNDRIASRVVSYTPKYPDDKGYSVVTTEPVQNKDSIGWYNEKTYVTDASFDTTGVKPDIMKKHLVDKTNGVFTYTGRRLSDRTYQVTNDSLNVKAASNGCVDGIKIIERKYPTDTGIHDVQMSSKVKSNTKAIVKNITNTQTTTKLKALAKNSARRVR